MSCRATPRPTLVAPPESIIDVEWLDADNVDYEHPRDAGLSEDDCSCVDHEPKTPAKRGIFRRFCKRKATICCFRDSSKET